MTDNKIKSIKDDFKDRLFFYPADGLYLLDMAKSLHIPKGDEYTLYSLMGGTQLRNLLPLYHAGDFETQAPRLDLHVRLPESKDEMLNMLNRIKKIADQIQTNDDLPPLIIGLIGQKSDDFKLFLRLLTSAFKEYINIRFVLAWPLETKFDDKTYTLLLYGFNPLNNSWADYLQQNSLCPKTIQEHNNQLFATNFGFFCLSAENTFIDAPQLDAFIHGLIESGVPALETHLGSIQYFGRSDIVRPLIETFGLLETGGFALKEGVS